MKNEWTRLIHKTFNNVLGAWLVDLYKKDKPAVLPVKERVFSAFKLTPYQDVSVVIVGQDPYHLKEQASGLAFSVSKDIPIPPSLKNIFKALKNDLGIENTNGDLTEWAKQGVLLINTALTVFEGQPGSHSFEWEGFTLSVIQMLNQHPSDLVFMLWGEQAKKLKPLIDPRHLILESSHPSPLSAHKGFLDCKHFSQANAFLQSKSRNPINWET